MRFLLLSDTHGNYPLAIRALEMAGQVDLIFHLGDGIDDARLIEEITGHRFIMVPGNCDRSAPGPLDVTAVFAGLKFFITHGDNYNVKGGLSLLQKKALTENVQIVLYGHTHTGSIELLDGILFVNPGCLRYRWPKTSYAILSIDSGTARAELFPIDS
ncbi:MAG TPA: metallophosphoesterase [Geobacteraceae bacterium]|nr:metallophosphoesterase [Geobacteraceae bacterium]